MASTTSSTIYSGYEVGSSAPVGQVLPGPANVPEIVQDVEAMKGGSSFGGSTLGGSGSGVLGGRSTGLYIQPVV